MKLIDIVNGVNALRKLGMQDLPLRVSYQINKTVGKLREDYEFFTREEQRLLDTFRPIRIEGTTVMFETPEIAEEYRKAHREIELMDADTEIRPIEIDIRQRIDISARDLSILEETGMIRIIGDEDPEEDDAEEVENE